MKTFDLDAHNSAGLRETGMTLMSLLNVLQDRPISTRAHALFAAFILYCEENGLNPSDLAAGTRRLMSVSEASPWHAHVRAARAYIREDLDHTPE